ncbi:MAG: response regulator, partial [Deltaproteobacteria bacterium]|nr:response regulator [Deltaproteobacteria bacterium]
MSSHPFVLIIEENDGHRFLIEEQLKAGFPLAHIECAHSFGEALKLLPQKKWDLLILNAKLSDGNGIDFLDEITEHHPFAAVAILTDNPENHVVPADSRHRGSVELDRKS